MPFPFRDVYLSIRLRIRKRCKGIIFFPLFTLQVASLASSIIFCEFNGSFSSRTKQRLREIFTWKIPSSRHMLRPSAVAPHLLTSCPTRPRISPDYQPDRFSVAASLPNFTGTSLDKMLEYFAYKKWKKHKSNEALKKETAKEALDKSDEAFIRRNLLDDLKTPSFLKFGKKKMETPTKEELKAVSTDGKLYRRPLCWQVGTATPNTQEEELNRVLSSLHLALEKKTAFSLSDETRALLKEFTQILKDIQSGGPHAYDDLTKFLNRKNNELNLLFDSIPAFMKTLISALPFPIARKLDKKSSKDMTADILKDLTKPGIITSLLRNIMNVLRRRFPALAGSNALYVSSL